MNGRLRNPDLCDHNALIPTSNTLGLSDFFQPPRATTLAEPLVNPGPRVILPNLTRDSTPTADSSTGEIPTPGSEAEPPTKGLVGGSKFTNYNNHGWEVNSAFDPDSNSSMMGY